MKALYAAPLAWSLVGGMMAFAQDLPSAFRVTGVAADDVLNIRAAPSATAAVIGMIGPDGEAVEVIALSPDARWGKVGLPEGNGWVAMRFLDAMPVTEAHLIPRPLTCLGTEPFWSIRLLPEGADYASPDNGTVALSLTEEAVGREGFFFRVNEGPTLIRSVIVRREWCSDGMSDREFGFSALMFSEAPDGNSVLAGCCTLDNR